MYKQTPASSFSLSQFSHTVSKCFKGTIMLHKRPQYQLWASPSFFIYSFICIAHCLLFQSAFSSSYLSAATLSATSSMSLTEKMKQLNKERTSDVSQKDLTGIYRELKQRKEELAQELSSFSEVVLQLKIQAELGNFDPLFGDSQTLYTLLPQHTQIIFQEKIKSIQSLKLKIRQLEETWKRKASNADIDDVQNEEIEGIWHQPDTTLGQLIIDYNTSDVVYVMPPEIANLKVHLSSQLPIPKSSWSEMLELVVAQMGIGIKQIMPFLKQLYFFRINQSGLKTITDDRLLLDGLSDDAKVAFVLSPAPGDLRRVYQFIDKFTPQEQMIVQLLGGQIVVIGLVREVQEVLKVYDFISSPKRAQEYKLVSLEKADSEEVAKILSSIFEGDSARGVDATNFSMDKPMSYMTSGLGTPDGHSGFRVIAMKHPASSLFIMGKPEQIEKAMRIINDIETNIGEIQDKTIYWYACQHSEAEELAKVLSQVYVKLISVKNSLTSYNNNSQRAASGTSSQNRQSGQNQKPQPESSISAQTKDNLIVQASMISMSDTKSTSTDSVNENFIVDPKTNSIIMVVENFVLTKLKELVKKLDVPKKMVQIDVLMFEKRVSDSSSFGLNLLRTGSIASGKHGQSVVWNDASIRKQSKNKNSKITPSFLSLPDARGILQFAISRGKGGALPAYELAYQFLLSQEDIQINANPSIITVNQTPAKIAVVDQISISNGAVEFDRDHFKESYSRAEYGITIQITPTVHAKMDQEEEFEGPKYVTLSTEIIFDTTQSDHQDRPDVTRRNIKNEVRVKDGETVILGGLRKKHSSGSQQSVPFLGDLPGIGKLFSTTALSDTSSEMFIFITPKIIPDSRDAAYKMRYDQLIRRPGDIPEFIQEIERAKVSNKRALFERSLKLILSPPLVDSVY